MMIEMMNASGQPLQATSNPFSLMQEAGSVDFLSFMGGIFDLNLPDLDAERVGLFPVAKTLNVGKTGTAETQVDNNDSKTDNDLSSQLTVSGQALIEDQPAVISKMGPEKQKDKQESHRENSVDGSLSFPQTDAGVIAGLAVMVTNADEVSDQDITDGQMLGSETVSGIASVTEAPQNMAGKTWIKPDGPKDMDTGGEKLSFAPTTANKTAGEALAETSDVQIAADSLQTQPDQTQEKDDFIQFLMQDRTIHSTETINKVSAFFTEMDTMRQASFNQSDSTTQPFVGNTVSLTGQGTAVSVGTGSQAQTSDTGTDDAGANVLLAEDKAITKADPLTEESGFKKEVQAEQNIAIALDKAQQTFKADLPVKETTSASQSPVYAQVSDQVYNAVKENGTTSFTMKLHPEGLGEIQVTLDCQDAKVSLEIVTDNPATQKLLEGQSNELKAALLTKNYEVSVLHVTSKTDVDAATGQPFSFFDRSSAQQQQYRQNGDQITYSYSGEMQNEDNGATTQQRRQYVPAGQISIWA